MAPTIKAMTALGGIPKVNNGMKQMKAPAWAAHPVAVAGAVRDFWLAGVGLDFIEAATRHLQPGKVALVAAPNAMALLAGADTLREALAIKGPAVLEIDMDAWGPFAVKFAGPPKKKD